MESRGPFYPSALTQEQGSQTVSLDALGEGGERTQKLSPSSKTWNNYFYNCPKVTQRRGLGEGKGEVLMKLHRKGTFIIYIVHFSPSESTVF